MLRLPVELPKFLGVPRVSDRHTIHLSKFVNIVADLLFHSVGALVRILELSQLGYFGDHLKDKITNVERTSSNMLIVAPSDFLLVRCCGQCALLRISFLLKKMPVRGSA